MAKMANKCGCVESIEYDDSGKVTEIVVNFGSKGITTYSNPAPGIVKAAERSFDHCREFCEKKDEETGKPRYSTGRKRRSCCEEPD